MDTSKIIKSGKMFPARFSTQGLLWLPFSNLSVEKIWEWSAVYLNIKICKLTIMGHKSKVTHWNWTIEGGEYRILAPEIWIFWKMHFPLYEGNKIIRFEILHQPLIKLDREKFSNSYLCSNKMRKICDRIYTLETLELV